MIVPLAWLIVPGQSLGHLRVSEPSDRVEAMLGKPTGADAAMGHFWTTWVGRGGGRVDVYSTRKSDDRRGHPDVTVETIRATSSRFRLANDLHPGSPSSGLTSAFSSARPVGSYVSPLGKVTIWDDVARGLAWEAAPNGRTVALLVHDAGRPLSPSVGSYVSSPLQRG